MELILIICVFSLLATKSNFQISEISLRLFFQLQILEKGALQSIKNKAEFACLVMILCFQNCSDFLQEKNVLVFEIYFFEIRGRRVEQFIRTVKGQNNF